MISQEDVDRVNDIRNHPQFEAGFDGDSDDLSSSVDNELDNLFTDGGSDFGFDNDPFSGDGSSSSSFNDSFGNDSGFGGGFTSNASPFGNDSNFGGSPFGSFGNNPPQAQAQVQQKDTMDLAMEAASDTMKTLGSIMMDLFKSVSLRTADDFGYFSTNMIKVALVAVPVSVVLGITGSLAGIKMLSFSGLGLQGTLAGALSLTSGIAGIGMASLILVKKGDEEEGTIDNIPDIDTHEKDSNTDNFMSEFEDQAGASFDDMFGNSSEFDDLFGSDDDDDTTKEISEPEPEEPEEEEFDADLDTEIIDYNAELEKIDENDVISRENLFNTFKVMLPTNTPKFYERSEISVDDTNFKLLETICLKALANLANCELEEVNSHLESATEGFFSYELRLKRINKVKKTEELAREIENYMRESSSDESVTATVDIEGDFYKITVAKGETAVVTFGDIFKDQKNVDFYLDTKNKLPVILGIDALGNVVLEDAKLFDSMLIAGKPRSGKSWYVLSIIFSMMLFNSPEEVQFCIVDPKESNLFKTIALMPHVFGLHNHKHILKILDDLIDVEAPRRKKLLDDNRCDDIWALNKKGIKLPVIWLVIDEFMTVIGDFDEKEDKDAFNIKLRTLLSQLPSLGIRLLFVPHRATGVVDKTQRTLLQFTAAVRADTDDVKDTLGIQKWDRALVKPGDIALKTSTMKNARYVRGAALTTEDAENTLFIETAAKAFYKKGVDIPDMSNLRVAYNRDEKYIQEELGGQAIRVQYNAANILKDIEDDEGISIHLGK